jgi:hypothetical protein
MITVPNAQRPSKAEAPEDVLDRIHALRTDRNFQWFMDKVRAKHLDQQKAALDHRSSEKDTYEARMRYSSLDDILSLLDYLESVMKDELAKKP